MERKVHDRLPVRLGDHPGTRPSADRVGHPPGGGIVPETEGDRLTIPPCRADRGLLRAGAPDGAEPAVRHQGARPDPADMAPGGEDPIGLGDPDLKARIVLDVEDLPGRDLRGEDDGADRTADPDPAPGADLLDQVGAARRELVEDEEPVPVGLGRLDQDTLPVEEPDLPPGERAVELRIIPAVPVRIEEREAGDRGTARLCCEQAGDEDQEEEETMGHMVHPT